MRTLKLLTAIALIASPVLGQQYGDFYWERERQERERARERFEEIQRQIEAEQNAQRERDQQEQIDRIQRRQNAIYYFFDVID